MIRLSKPTHMDRIHFFLANVSFYFAYNLFSGFMVLYLTANGYSALYCGMVNTVINIINMVLQPLIGYITDTYVTVKKYLVVSSVLLVGAVFLFPMAVGDPLLCFAAVVVISLFALPYMFLLDTWVVGARAERPHLDYGQIRAGGSIGAGTASLIFGFVIAKTGFGSMFIAQSLCFAVLLVLMRFLPDLPLKNGGAHAHDTPVAGAVAAEKVPFLQAMKVLSTSKNYLFVIIVVLLFHISNKPIGIFFSLFVEGRGGNSTQFGFAIGLGALIEGVIMVFVGHMLRRYKIEAMFTLALGLNVLRCLMVLFTQGVVGLVASQIIQSACYAIGYISIVEYFSRVSPAHIRTTAMTLGLAFTGGFSALIANIVGGMLCDTVGTMSVVWFSLVCGATSLVLYGGYWLLQASGTSGKNL